jgi:serine/threonine protein phosphatase PrpC
MNSSAVETDRDLASAVEAAVPAAGLEHSRVQVRSSGLTDRGRVRETNEDQFLIAVLAKTLHIQESSLPQAKVQQSREQGFLFVVADGMGGHAGGEEASALAIDSIGSFALDTLKWFFELEGKEADQLLTEFRTALLQADAKIFAAMKHRPELAGMGTTLTMAYSLGDELFVAHVGDSRCYLLREGKLYRLTRDHTMVEDMIRQGYLQPEEAARHRLRHVITNVVGGTDRGVQVEVHKLHLEPEDVVLLCTDGLTEMVHDEDIARLLESNPDSAMACQSLVDRANEQCGRDNITVIVARYERES